MQLRDAASESEGSAIRVQTLGAFTVWRDMECIPQRAWRRKPAALFKALLSARDYRLHRDQVVELLWPDRDPVQADNNLRFTLHRLRTLLDPPNARHSHIARQDHTLILVPSTLEPNSQEQASSPDWLDAARFAADAARALAGQEPDACKAALARYTGVYLPNDRYEDWALSRSEELGRQHLAVLLHYARLIGKSGTREESGSAWQTVLSLDPCHEEAAYTLMRMLGDSGRVSEALRIHAAHAVALRRELAVNPAAAIEKLRARLVAHTTATTADAVSAISALGGAPPAPPSPPRTNLHPAMTSFVGRLAEQTTVRERLRQARLLTLIGIGGSGKTRLALQTAGTLSADFRDGIWLVELATLSDSAGILEQVAAAVSMPGPSTGPSAHGRPDSVSPRSAIVAGTRQL
jgi:DNA-binding SARP family transcriptional activator